MKPRNQKAIRAKEADVDLVRDRSGQPRVRLSLKVDGVAEPVAKSMTRLEAVRLMTRIGEKVMEIDEGGGR
ncbi:hypothetical protein [Paludisphaera rhizosphaerae]|uniref:hypothetical protein n=1 Tax=Paludisphaera rhizosphaerae TaxID=2711216 RepID=UPI0013ED3F77|nr:hypothetical protein [Paludisphaera rhizosphaerae]